RALARRGDPPDIRRGVGLEPVRLISVPPAKAGAPLPYFAREQKRVSRFRGNDEVKDIECPISLSPARTGASASSSRGNMPPTAGTSSPPLGNRARSWTRPASL